ncbi:MAG: SRPBCC family protein [Actinomycetota bacterium]|nr:SRPBCC family protein [Actinomycetota bacterium]
MSSWRKQALIDAPVGVVWDLVGDPNRHPEWFPRVVEVKGLPRVEHEATYRQVTRQFGGKVETTFAIEQLDELRNISLRCLDTGTYVRWLLAEARDSTFADIEMGFEPMTFSVRVFDATIGRRFCRRWTEDALEGLARATRGSGGA